MMGLCAALADQAGASTFTISPIRAELGGVHRTEAMTLTNVDADPVLIEVHVVDWSQVNGVDQLDDTRELLATPPVLQIPAKGEQIIRVALRHGADTSKELSYRVIFQEVPEARSADFNGLQVALRLSVPVFVAPLQGRASADLAWEAHWDADGQLDVSVVNHGTGHSQVLDFDVQLAGDGGTVHSAAAKYVLPGSRMSWRLAPADRSRAAGPVSIHGHSDQGEFAATLDRQTGS